LGSLQATSPHCGHLQHILKELYGAVLSSAYTCVTNR
jgi:hypothetical protein